MAGFKTELEIKNIRDDLWELAAPLIYESDLLQYIITVPVGFITDLASVPRVPVAYWFWGGRVHREAVVHDYLYRIDSVPMVARDVADQVFMEAMQARDKRFLVRWPMYFGVRVGGFMAYHKKRVFEDTAPLGRGCAT